MFLHLVLGNIQPIFPFLLIMCVKLMEDRESSKYTCFHFCFVSRECLKVLRNIKSDKSVEEYLKVLKTENLKYTCFD